ncbi:MAG: MlaD family protein, partial [Caulobacteraceae bacterium]
SYATLEPQGITGVNYIDITAGTPTRPLLKNTVPRGVVPRLGSRPSAIANLLAGGGFIVQRTVDLLDRANRLFSDQNIKTLSATLSDVQAVTAELRQRKSIIADADVTVRNAGEAAAQVRELAKSSDALVNGPAKSSLTQIGDAAKEIDASAKDLQGLLASLKGPTAQFAAEGLPRLTEDLSSIKRASDHLDRLLTAIQANPRGFLSAPPAREEKVKP